MKEAKRTPGPWHIERPYAEPGLYISAKNTDLVARVFEYEAQDPKSEANADFIVRACNAHDGLVEALKYIVDWKPGLDSWDGYTARDLARAALARAEAPDA